MKLKNCPFCGSTDCHTQCSDELEEWSVYCYGCTAVVEHFKTEEAAIKAWNTRTLDTEFCGINL